MKNENYSADKTEEASESNSKEMVGYKTLAAIVSALGTASTFRDSIRACVDAIDKYTHFSAIAILRLDPADESLELIESVGFSIEAIRAGPLSLDDSLSGVAVSQKRVIATNDIEHDERINAAVQKDMVQQGGNTLISLPLMLHGRAVGAMNLLWNNPVKLSVEDREALMQIGYALAIAVVHEQREYESTHDSLTGLHSRREFDFRLQQIIELSRRYGNTASLIILDIDDFKKCNDTHGHVVGDKALQVLANEISSCLRLNDIAFRYGGEEFTIILPETDTEGAMIVAERIRSGYPENKFEDKDGNPFTLTVSAGIAQYKNDKKESITDFIQRADDAMYKAKHEGKNKVVVFN